MRKGNKTRERGGRATSASPRKQQQAPRSSYHHHPVPTPPPLNSRPKVVWVKTGHMSYTKKLIITTSPEQPKCDDNHHEDDTTTTTGTRTPQCHKPSPTRIPPSNGLSPASEGESQASATTSPQELSASPPLTTTRHTTSSSTSRDTLIPPPPTTSSSGELGASPGSRAVDCLMLLLDQPLKAAKLLKEVRPQKGEKRWIPKGRREEMAARNRLADYMASFDNSSPPIDGHLSAITEETASEMGGESQTSRRKTPGVPPSRPLLPLRECEGDLDVPPQAADAVVETSWEALSAPGGLSPAPSVNSNISAATDDLCPGWAPLVELSLKNDTFLQALYLADEGSRRAADDTNGDTTSGRDHGSISHISNDTSPPPPSIRSPPICSSSTGSHRRPQASGRSPRVAESGKVTSATKQHWKGFGGAIKDALFTPLSSPKRGKTQQLRPTSSGGRTTASIPLAENEFSPPLLPSAPMSAPLATPGTTLLHSSHPAAYYS